MSKKEKIIRIAIIVILIVILIAIVVLTLVKNNKINKPVENAPEPTTPNINEAESEKNKYRKCQKNSEGVENIYEEVTIYYIELDDERVISGYTTAKLKFLAEENYQQAKENKTYGDTAVYDDNSLTIEYNLGESNDYTKDDNGVEINVKYNEFIGPFEQNGYICDKVNE